MSKRRYKDAHDAWNRYQQMLTDIEGSPGLDYEKRGMKVDSQPSPENPHLNDLTDVWALEEVFTEAAELLAMATAGAIDKNTLERVRGKVSSEVDVHDISWDVSWDEEDDQAPWETTEIWRTWVRVKERIGKPEPQGQRETRAVKLAAGVIEERLQHHGLLIRNATRD